jgi:hypothetical protein
VLPQLNGTLVVNVLWDYIVCSSEFYTLFNVSATPGGPYSDAASCVPWCVGGWWACRWLLVTPALSLPSECNSARHPHSPRVSADGVFGGCVTA